MVIYGFNLRPMQKSIIKETRLQQIFEWTFICVFLGAVVVILCLGFMGHR